MDRVLYTEETDQNQRISKMDSSQAELYYAQRKQFVQQSLMQKLKPSNSTTSLTSAEPHKEFIVYNQAKPPLKPKKAKKYTSLKTMTDVCATTRVKSKKT